MPKPKRPAVLAIVGPTSSGKSAAAIRIADKLNGEIVSADSMMVYRGMDIGTAKPPLILREKIPHHMIDIADPADEFSAAVYQPKARRVIEDIIARGRLPIVTGGTGLYVSAAVDDLRFPSSDEATSVRETLMIEAEMEGSFKMHQRLKEIDPAAASTIHINNTRRVIRALEVYQLTGRKFSETGRGFKARTAVFDVFFAGIEFDRDELYRRINVRTDRMIAGGWADETAALYSDGRIVGKTAAKAIGYSELKRFLDGELSLPDATELIKTATRRYAKRQMTWFKADQRIVWFKPAGGASDAIETADAIELYINEKL